MELTTKRCLIRQLKMNDADDLCQVLSDADVMQYIEPVFDIEKTRDFGIDHFGDYAGYAQLYLFHYARKSGLMEKIKK